MTPAGSPVAATRSDSERRWARMGQPLDRLGAIHVDSITWTRAAARNLRAWGLGAMASAPDLGGRFDSGGCRGAAQTGRCGFEPRGFHRLDVREDVPETDELRRQPGRSG